MEDSTLLDDVHMEHYSTAYTTFCADSIEWCPHTEKQNLFLIGNYELLGNEQGKIGQVYLSKLLKSTSDTIDIPENETCGVKCAATQTTYAQNNSDLSTILSNPKPTVQRKEDVPTFEVCDRITTPAVLDLKWSNVPLTSGDVSHNVFAGAYEDGSVRLYTVNTNTEEDNTSPILMTSALQIGRGALCLSLDWSNRRFGMWEGLDHISNPQDYLQFYRDQSDLTLKMDEYEENILPSNTFLATSLSDGSATVADVFMVDNLPSLSIRHHWQAHQHMEAWIIGIDYWNTNTVYTGADDQLFKTWDLRMIDVVHPDYYGKSINTVKSSKPLNMGRLGHSGVVASDFALNAEEIDDYDPDFSPSQSFPMCVSQSHQQGVCSIQCHPYNPYILATGSYDDHVYIWDKRNMKSPIASQLIGGGVWRLKWHPNPKYSHMLLIVNMYNGVHIVEVEGLKQDFSGDDGLGCIFTDTHSDWPSASTVNHEQNNITIGDSLNASVPNLYSHTVSTPTVSSPTSHYNIETYLGSSRNNLLKKWASLGIDGFKDISPNITASYYQHGTKTIAYGGDWCWANNYKPLFTNDKHINALISTCSFYNKRVDLVGISK